jgi:hypothetical protein
VFPLSEINIPVVKLTVSNVSVPAVNVYVPVAVRAYALLSVTLPAVCVNVGTALYVPVV